METRFKKLLKLYSFFFIIFNEILKKIYSFLQWRITEPKEVKVLSLIMDVFSFQQSESTCVAISPATTPTYEEQVGGLTIPTTPSSFHRCLFLCCLCFVSMANSIIFIKWCSGKKYTCEKYYDM